MANAILPANDNNPAHTGIQKVDRTTVTELRDVAAAYAEIQAKVDTADLGLNPLGLARNVPFPSTSIRRRSRLARPISSKSTSAGSGP